MDRNRISWTGSARNLSQLKATGEVCDLNIECGAARRDSDSTIDSSFFPKADEAALAWSLGTSVNSLGTEHHILQKVDDGQLVADAFVDLWEQLNKPEHLIWKKP